MQREEFLERYMEIQRPLRAYLLAATGKLHDADDLSQAVWEVLWKKQDEYDEARPFKAWCFGIARLEVLKWRQAHARSREVLSGETLERLAETGTECAEHISSRQAFLLDCVAELGVLPRRVVDLKYGEGRRSKEIGEMVNRSTSAIDMMLSRIRRALRDCVERRTIGTP